MPYYSPELIQQVSEANDIVEVISQFVPLKKKGRNYVACCPFHQEKTPSFTVDPIKKFYYCFGCHEGGNVFKFLQKHENLSFPEAVEYLANRANISLPSSDNIKDIQKAKENQSIYNVNAQAGNYFYKNLKSSPKALGYLVDRGIPHKIIFEFGLGYSKNEWADLYDYLSKNNVPKELMSKAGLVNTSNDRPYDLFKDRLIIPIQNVMGKVIAFGGRKFNDKDKGPKYLNSPDTPVFNKRKQLFNLNRAKSLIRDNPLILVEGYMDVIALYSYGFKNTAAALGTAFTSDHVKLISQYTSNLILCFDGDRAGEKATEKAIEILKGSPLKVNIVRLPEEEDPDSYIRKFGVEAFKEQLKKAVSIPEFLINQLEKQYNLNNSNEKIDFIIEACKIIKPLNPVEQAIYIKKVATKTDIDEETIKNQLEITSTESKKTPQKRIQRVVTQPKPTKKKNTLPRELFEAQNIFLSYCLANPEFITSSGISEKQLFGRFYSWLFNRLKSINKANPTAEEIIISEEDQVYSDRLYRFLLNSGIKSENVVRKAVEVINKYYRKKEIARLANDLTNDERNNQQNLYEKILDLKKVDWEKT